jgi:16S rRNA (adenine(1408)-N(1))-methyltransferase
VIGFDADAASMRESSARAARRKGGLPNAVFVVSSAESLPSELDSVADAVTINFPWGSLLRGIVSGSGPVLEAVARSARGGAEISVLLSIEPRDVAAAGVQPSLDGELSERWARTGLEVRDIRPAEPYEVASSGSSWAKRLRAGSDRKVTLIRAVRL